jgi:hypothetical protein
MNKPQKHFDLPKKKTKVNAVKTGIEKKKQQGMM